ncbi:hypothetical protein SAMN04488128_10428 [Chitinophaga eiseniae]|uniref:Uncharacterized protein n=1 Tax=Chitinophaga eiseniae TaxID=634771 RepID=A0A1T4T617_9BACT|nr:hypothetical protein [Chitinophaga eiseniae]SKA35954.1 hypothetical protein SAMN04488128_10428 [Chitinophaga eiseniae]
MFRLTLLLSLLLSGIKTYSQPASIHVLVALCDNKYQGIVKVPPKIGNGQDPANNLYWGCGYGVKTFLKKQPDWQLIKQVPHPGGNIYERIILKHRKTNTYLIADAYDGAKMKETITDFLHYAAGQKKVQLSVDTATIRAGGNAGLIVFVGHNGLMDFSLPATPVKSDNQQRDVAIFACASKPYFAESVRKTGAQPLIWTTHLMSPEAYTLVPVINGWLQREKPAVIHERVAQAYHQYQHCGIKGARRLFATGW